LKRTKEEILFRTVKEDNILPITSICRLNCIFCSHKNNPNSVETYSFGHLDFDLIKLMIEFLDENKPVIIGESASKIIEGEPFTHPEIIKILRYLRKKKSDIKIKVTSSASFIKKSHLKIISNLKAVELNISLNAPAPQERVFLMNDPEPENVFKIIAESQKYNIDFNASIVSMHHLIGLEKLKKTLDFLENYQPQSLRVFMPGFSRDAAEELIPPDDYYQILKNYIENLRNYYSYPIILEPQILNDFSADVIGIIKDSPADQAEIKIDDKITEINSSAVKSSTEAFYKLKRAKNPDLSVNRDGKKLDLSIKKSKDENSGLVMAYDLSSRKKENVLAHLREAISKKENKICIITSKNAYSLFESILNPYLKISSDKARLIYAENRFFGGTINSAGLLVNSDIISALKKLDFNADRLILPEIMYDYYGNDLLGNHYSQLEEFFKLEVILI